MYRIAAFHFQAIGSGSSSLAPTVYESDSKIEFNQFHQSLPVWDISKALFVGTTSSNNEMAPGLSTTSSPKQESTKIERLEYTDS